MKIRGVILTCAALLMIFVTALPAHADNETSKHRTVLLPGEYACTLTNPQYTVYSKASEIVMREHANVLSMNAAYQKWANAYLSAGFNPGDYNSESCNAYGYGRAQPLPLPVSAAGPMTTSIRLRTTGHFSGDGGYDLWLTRDPGAHTYADMTHSRDNTELMVWVDHPGLGIGGDYGGSPVAHHVYVDGRYWDILHAGRTAWHPWEYLVFATENANRGDFTMRGLHLGSLIRWAVAHGYVRRDDTIQAVDAGFEGHALAGGTSVRGYRLKIGRAIASAGHSRHGGRHRAKPRRRTGKSPGSTRGLSRGRW